MTYLHQHVGYTRVHNRLTGTKDLQRLPGLAAIAYQHETSRCGDPHLHTHVIVPNRQARADGTPVSLDSKSLYHEAKAAGIIYQATLPLTRPLVNTESSVMWRGEAQQRTAVAAPGCTAMAALPHANRDTRQRAVRSALQAKQPESATGIRMVLRGGSILFDIDATLVDSTAVVERSWRPEDRWRGGRSGARDSHQDTSTKSAR